MASWRLPFAFASLGCCLITIASTSSSVTAPAAGKHVRNHTVEALMKLLELRWPDPNRHGAATPEPRASLKSARCC
jgi:hypothetical protein